MVTDMSSFWSLLHGLQVHDDDWRQVFERPQRFVQDGVGYVRVLHTDLPSLLSDLLL